MTPEEIARLRELEAKATQPDAWRNGDKFVFVGALVEHAPSLLSLAERVGKLEEALRGVMFDHEFDAAGHGFDVCRFCYAKTANYRADKNHTDECPARALLRETK